jgi:thiol-disulfide isomerase/thioredoxin
VGVRWPCARAVVALAALTVATGMLQGCGFAQAPPRSHDSPTDVVGLRIYPVGSREKAPALAGVGLDGSRVSLREVGHGDIVFVNVWASWCAPCRSESPLLARSAAALSARGVRFLGIDETDQASAARSFVRRTGVTYPQLVDPDGKLLRTLRMLPQRGIPSTLVVDRRGRIAGRVIGRITAADIRAVVDHLEHEG